jgi:hypothetical protein
VHKKSGLLLRWAREIHNSSFKKIQKILVSKLAINITSGTKTKYKISSNANSGIKNIFI